MSLIIATHVCLIMLDWALISKAYGEAEENRKYTSETQPEEIEMKEIGGAAWPGTVLKKRIDTALL